MYYLITPELMIAVETPQELPLSEHIRRDMLYLIDNLQTNSIGGTLRYFGASFGPQHFVFNEAGWKNKFVREHELAHAALEHHRRRPLDSQDELQRELAADQLAVINSSPEEALEVLQQIKSSVPPWMIYPGLEARINAINQLIEEE